VTAERDGLTDEQLDSIAREVHDVPWLVRLVNEIRGIRAEAAALAPRFRSKNADLADQIARLDAAAREAEDLLASLLRTHREGKA
jgi:hypothetical protein